MTKSAAGGGTPTHRHWIPWTVVGGVGAIVVAAAVVVAPSLVPVAASSPAPSVTTLPPSAPPPPTCQVTPSAGAWFDGGRIDLPANGRFTETFLADVAADYAIPTIVDDSSVVLVASGYETPADSVIVLDRGTGEVVWQTSVVGYGGIVATPATSGVDGKILVSSHDPSNPAATVVTSYSSDSGHILASRTFDGDWVGQLGNSAGRAAWATIAPTDAGAYWVTTRDAALRLDPETLEPLVTVTGEEYGVGQFEGGVPFRLAGEVLFVGGHAVDATDGTSLGWETQASPLSAAGYTLTTPIVYDSMDPYALTGLDVRTGESCWSHQVISVAATDEQLWIVTGEEVLQRIDPATGAVLHDFGGVGDSSVQMLAGAVVTSPRYWDASPDAAAIVHDADGDRFSFPFERSLLHSTPSQILSTTQGTVSMGGELTAIDPSTGEVVWTLPVGANGGERVELDAGIAWRTTPLGDGRVRLTLIH